MSYAEQLQASDPLEVAEQSEAAERQGSVENKSYHSSPRSRYLEWKYPIERMLGCLLLIPAAPVILLLCCLVKFTSSGPGLYRQVRLGYQGRSYEVLKIRTMSLDAEADGVARWCTKNDPRVTRLGRFLRSVHLDEFPQLINVARGEMVLVGPRPERPQISAILAENIEGYYDRLSVMPGITGLAQINLPPDETLDDARRKHILDLQYVQEAGLWLDFRMLLATGLRICGIRGDSVTRAMRLCRRSLLVNLSTASDPFDAITESNVDEAILDRDASYMRLEDGKESPSCPNGPPRRPR